MIFKGNLISAGEAAYILQHQLGSMRQWRDFLSDNIRGRQCIEGLTLMPRGRLQNQTGYGPAYLLADVKAFILAVKAACPDAGKRITPVPVQLDTARGWMISKFDKHGHPVAMFRGLALLQAHICG